MCADRIRIVLDIDVDEFAYAPLVVRHNWRNQNRIPRKGDQHFESVYSTDDKANWIHYVDDHKLKVKYMLVVGPQAAQIEKIIRQGVVNWPTEMIRDRANKPKLSRDDRSEVLYHLAIDTVERGFDQQVFDIYLKALGDPDPAVRKAAVLGSSYLGWPQLAEPLRPLATDAEKDEEIRNEAQLLLDKLDAHTN